MDFTEAHNYEEITVNGLLSVRKLLKRTTRAQSYNRNILFTPTTLMLSNQVKVIQILIRGTRLNLHSICTHQINRKYSEMIIQVIQILFGLMKFHSRNY